MIRNRYAEWRHTRTFLVLFSLLPIFNAAAAAETIDIALSKRPAARAAAVSGGSAPSISAPESSATTSGLGFSVAATITDPDPSDSVTVSVTGAPQGTTLTVARSLSGMTVAALGGVVSGPSGPQSYEITWEAVDSEGLASRARSVIRVVPPASGDVGTKVRQVVRRRYEFGIPAKDVRELGPAALPHILEVLRDPASQQYWGNAVVAAGMLGLPAVFDSLHAFIWTRFSGTVDPDVFDALFQAQAVLGAVAPARPEALDYLIASSDPAYWVDLPWRYGVNTHLDVLMSGRSIYGLSIIADGRAVAALNHLSSAPFSRYQKSYIREGIARQQSVLQKGWMAVREDVQRDSMEGR